MSFSGIRGAFLGIASAAAFGFRTGLLVASYLNLQRHDFPTPPDALIADLLQLPGLLEKR